MELIQIPVKKLKLATYNPRRITERELKKLVTSIEENGFVQPILVNKDLTIIGGHQRVKAAKQLNIDTVPAIVIDVSPEKEKELNLALNKISGDWEETALRELLEELEQAGRMYATGFEAKELDKLRFKQGNQINRKLIQDYIVPPFSIFDTKQGYWQTRKKEWHEQLGNTTLNRNVDNQESTPGDIGGGTYKTISQYDPVMIEVLLTWYASRGDIVLDPFSGSSLAGLIASRLGYTFIGTDTWAEQVKENKDQAKELKETNCTWHNDTAENIGKYLPKGKKATLLITDPPYFNLENYQSENKDDISNAENYKDFLARLKKALTPTYELLEKNGWAVIKIGNVRDKDGHYYNLVGDTVNIMQEIGYSFYNEIILATPIGTATLRARRVMEASKKVTKIHQNILFFSKGREVKINKHLKEILLEGRTATAHHDILVFKK